MTCIYTYRPDQQIRLLYLLAGNCELQENLVKAEGYYSSLQKKEVQKKRNMPLMVCSWQDREGERRAWIYMKNSREKKKGKAETERTEF